MTKPEIEQLRAAILELEAQLDDLMARLPAHTIPPAMVAEMDELDEKLAEARAKLESYTNSN